MEYFEHSGMPRRGAFAPGLKEKHPRFAPHMSHAVMREGRKCDDCHGMEIMKQAKEGKVKLTWLEDGEPVNLKGVIPVLDRIDYECSYQDMKEGEWVPISNPPKPLCQYVAYGEPLTKEQLEHLLIPQESASKSSEQK